MLMDRLRGFFAHTRLGDLIREYRAIKRKHYHELRYWRSRFDHEGPLNGSHLPQFYTAVFGLSTADYTGKRILDIGCGPRGSLEWAELAAERVGLDPLADEYRKLGTVRHKMKYVAAPSEHIPFEDAHFDFITTFNSLDHVDDLGKTLSEIKRVAADHAQLLIIVEINHPPTPTEPITLTSDVLRQFAPEFRLIRYWSVGLLPGTHDIHGSVLAAIPATADAPAVLCARLVKNAV